MLASLRDMVRSQKPAEQPASKAHTTSQDGKAVGRSPSSPKKDVSSPSLVEAGVASQGQGHDKDVVAISHSEVSQSSITTIRGSVDRTSPPLLETNSDDWLKINKSPRADHSATVGATNLRSHFSATVEDEFPECSETTTSSSSLDCRPSSGEASFQLPPPHTPSTGGDADTDGQSFFCFPPQESVHPELAAYLQETNALFLSSLEEIADPLDSRLPSRDTPADRAEWQAKLMAAVGRDVLSAPMWAEMLGGEEALGGWDARVEAEHEGTGAPVPLTAWRRLRAELQRAEMRALEREVRGLGERKRELVARDAEIARLSGMLRELGEEESDSHRRRRAREEAEDQVAAVQQQAAERVVELRERLLAAETRCDRLARSEQDKAEEITRLGEQLADMQGRFEEAQRSHSQCLLELVQSVKKEAAEKSCVDGHEHADLQQRVMELESQLRIRDEELLNAKTLAGEKSSLLQASSDSWETKLNLLTDMVRALDNRLSTSLTKSPIRSNPYNKERIAELELEQMLADYNQDTRLAEPTSEEQLRDVTKKLAETEQEVRQLRSASRARIPVIDRKTALLKGYPSLVPLLFPSPDDSDPLRSAHNFGSDVQHLSRKEYLEAFFGIKERQIVLMDRCGDAGWAADHPSWDPLAEAEGLIAELRELDAGEDADHIATSIATLHLVRAIVLSKRKPVGKEFLEALADVTANNRGEGPLASEALRLETQVLRRNPELRR